MTYSYIKLELEKESKKGSDMKETMDALIEEAFKRGWRVIPAKEFKTRPLNSLEYLDSELSRIEDLDKTNHTRIPGSGK